MSSTTFLRTSYTVEGTTSRSPDALTSAGAPRPSIRPRSRTCFCSPAGRVIGSWVAMLMTSGYRILEILAILEFLNVELLNRFCHRSEEHTSELQSLRHLVCRLLL